MVKQNKEKEEKTMMKSLLKCSSKVLKRASTKLIRGCNTPNPLSTFSRDGTSNFHFPPSSWIVFLISPSPSSCQELSNVCYHDQIQALYWNLFPSKTLKHSRISEIPESYHVALAFNSFNTSVIPHPNHPEFQTLKSCQVASAFGPFGAYILTS